MGSNPIRPTWVDDDRADPRVWKWYDRSHDVLIGRGELEGIYMVVPHNKLNPQLQLPKNWSFT